AQCLIAAATLASGPELRGLWPSSTALAAMCVSIAHVCKDWRREAGSMWTRSRNPPGKSVVDKKVPDTSRSCCKRLPPNGHVGGTATGDSRGRRYGRQK